MYGANGVHIVSLSIVNTWFPASTPLYLSILQFNQPLVSTLPDLCIQGFKSFDTFESADDSPEFGNVFDIARRHGLRKKVPDRCPFDRPGHDRARDRVPPKELSVSVTSLERKSRRKRLSIDQKLMVYYSEKYAKKQSRIGMPWQNGQRIRLPTRRSLTGSRRKGVLPMSSTWPSAKLPEYSARQILKSLRSYDCMHLNANAWQFTYYDEVLEAWGKAFGIPLDKKYRTQQEFQRLLRY